MHCICSIYIYALLTIYAYASMVKGSECDVFAFASHPVESHTTHFPIAVSPLVDENNFPIRQFSKMATAVHCGILVGGHVALHLSSFNVFRAM